MDTETGQVQGKEFDGIILANANRRYFPDKEESRLLFYVAVTRATKRWTLVFPEDQASPLLAHLGSP